MTQQLCLTLSETTRIILAFHRIIWSAEDTNGIRHILFDSVFPLEFNDVASATTAATTWMINNPVDPQSTWTLTVHTVSNIVGTVADSLP